MWRNAPQDRPCWLHDLHRLKEPVDGLATSGDLIWTKASLLAGQSGTIQVCAKVNLNATSDLTVQNVVSITGLHDSSLGGNNVDTKLLTFDKHKVYVPIVFK